MNAKNRLASTFIALTTAFSLAACGTTAGTSATQGAATSSTSASTAVATAIKSHAQADDVDYDAASAATITLQDNASTTSASTGVKITGNTVSITAPGTYVLNGSLSNGSVVVDSSTDGKVRLVLSDASITNASGAAISIKAADEAVVVLADGTHNTVTDGTGYDTSAEDAPNAALFSMADLTIGGTGSLTVNGNTDDGIASKDGLVILGGTVKVTATDDAIRGKDYVFVEGGSLALTAGQDGHKSNNETAGALGSVIVNNGRLTINAGDDGIHAEGALQITGGTVTIAQSTEGLEGSAIAVSGGATSVTSTDDGVNGSTGASTASTASGPGGGGNSDDGSTVVISGGTLNVNAEGDGLDSNGSLAISGGTITVAGPSGNGNGALDSNAGIAVTGGTLIAAGSGGMAEAPDSGSQSFLQAAASLSAGQRVQIRSGATVIASYTVSKEAANIVVSAKGITAGSSYDVVVDGTVVATATAGQSTGGGMGGGTGGGMGGPGH